MEPHPIRNSYRADLRPRRRRTGASTSDPCLADTTFAPFSTETGLQNLNLQVIDHETRLSSLEASGGVPDPVVTGAVHGSGTALTLRAGSTNVRIEAQDTTTLANFGLVENFLGGAPRLRVDEELFIDDVSDERRLCQAGG